MRVCACDCCTCDCEDCFAEPAPTPEELEADRQRAEEYEAERWTPARNAIEQHVRDMNRMMLSLGRTLEAELFRPRPPGVRIITGLGDL